MAMVAHKAMNQRATDRSAEVEFMRLLFTDPVEEQVAHRWASRFAGLVGPQVQQLRPQTTLAEMLNWAAAANVDSIDFTVVLEPELRMDLAEFLDYAEHVTFREMVQHYVKRFGS